MSFSWKHTLLGLVIFGILGTGTGHARSYRPNVTRYYYCVPTTGGYYYYPIYTSPSGERYYYPSERLFYVPPTAGDDLYLPPREDRPRAWRPGDAHPGFTHTNE